MKILLLGATSPIARAMALRFAADGANFYVAARDTLEAERIAKDAEVRAGAPAFSGTFEASDFGSHRAFLERAIERMGGLDGVILCFGTLGDEKRAQADPGEALSIINQNFTGAVSILTLAGEYFERQGTGFIIVLGSVAGVRGRASNYVYGSAKGALHLFLQGLRGRLAKTKVNVMTVVLGTVDTRMTYGRARGMLLVSPEVAADAIYQAWRKRREVVYVPWFWRPIMTVIRSVPERIFKHASF